MLFFLVIMVGCVVVFGQKVGINNTNPQTTFDINGALRIRTVVLSPIGNQIILPDSVGYLVVNSANAFFSITGGEAYPGRRLIVENNSGQSGELGSKPVQLEEGINEYVVNDINEWTRVGLLKESSWGLQGNTGTIPGLNAIGTNDNVDFSIETNNAERVRVKSDGRVGVGTINPSTKAILELSSVNKGLLLPRLADTSTIVAPVPAGLMIYCLADNKLYYYDGSHWAGASGEASELQKLMESGQTGWRLRGANAANYGTIGFDAIDLSASTVPSSFNGATGSSALATGFQTIASGSVSTALGEGTLASGQKSLAAGLNTRATGPASVSIGELTEAAGEISLATGYGTIALGDYSLSGGYFTKARSFASMALGQYNDTIAGSNPDLWTGTDPLLTLGNGTNEANRRNAMTFYKNGTLALQNQSSTPVNASGKFYMLNNEPYFGTRNLNSQLEKITEAGNTGWRMLGRNAANYGNIGVDAIDFSVAALSSNTYGATGLRSLAAGLETTASATNSTALGFRSVASEENSIAFGENSKATGYNSIATGYDTKAMGYASTTFGSTNRAKGDYSVAMGIGTISKYGALTIGQYNDTIFNESKTSWVATEPVFVVGNGSSLSSRNTAMTVFNNGTLSLQNQLTTPANSFGKFYMLNFEPYFGSHNLKGQLERITENSSTGWRILGRDPANYGDIGSGAIDFSDSNLPSSNKGATGLGAFAAGYKTTASGGISFAIGDNSLASGYAAISTGDGTTASNTASTAMGSGSTASGYVSSAIGWGAIASGDGSTALGSSTQATGANALVANFSNIARSYCSTALGRYNDAINTSSTTTWIDTDPLFLIGNGTDNATRKNAVAVLKNGNMGINTNTATHKLEVLGTGIVNGGTAAFKGSQWYSHFSYGTDEDTYIRGGKSASDVVINDITGLGNVGIGTATPSAKLDVVGDAKVSGSISIGGGETIAKVERKSFDYDIPSIPAFGFQQFNIAGVTFGLSATDNFIINPFGTIAPLIVTIRYINSTTFAIDVMNPSNVAVDVPNKTFQVVIIK